MPPGKCPYSMLSLAPTRGLSERGLSDCSAEVRSQSVEQRDGGSDVALHGDHLGVAGMRVVALPQPAQQVPERVAVQQLPVLGIVAFGEDACDPPMSAWRSAQAIRPCVPSRVSA